MAILRFCDDIIGMIGKHMTDRDIKNARLAHPCFRNACGQTNILSINLNRNLLAGFEKRLICKNQVYKNAKTLRIIVTDMDVAMYDIVEILKHSCKWDLELVTLHRSTATAKHLEWFARIAEKVKRIEILAMTTIIPEVHSQLVRSYSHSRILVNIIAIGMQPIMPIVPLRHMMLKLELSHTQTYVAQPEVFSTISFGKAFGLGIFQPDGYLASWLRKEKLVNLRKVRFYCDKNSISIIDMLARLPPKVEITLIDADFFVGLEVLYHFAKNKLSNKIIFESVTSEEYAQARILANLKLYSYLHVSPMEHLCNMRVCELRSYIRKNIRRKIDAVLFLYHGNTTYSFRY